MSRKRSFLPVERLSNTRTLAPSLRSRCAIWEPINPAPPVTKKVSVISQFQRYGTENGHWARACRLNNSSIEAEAVLSRDKDPLQTRRVYPSLSLRIQTRRSASL